ncbi:hypothetical protein HYALB_00011448 [Hymenoscyphus albidus]|uniref:Carboxylic ester hydrolase n=1 Tax=Hymenoscyphus albidus TaxID=595503 RepID=A0A9N9LSA4_9HELO|nr:hypothetical protein HYALB_00011448 [Hymenoscyphus albidus]
MSRSYMAVVVCLAFLWSLVLGFPEKEPSFKQRCQEFKPLSYVANATVNAQGFISAGQTILYPSNDPNCNRPSQNVSVDICRIALNFTTSDRSHVLSEVWLPQNWTGRFLATGNGGIDGCTKYEDIDYGVKYGLATVGSNNGHNGTGGASFLNNDEVLKDFVFRALHSSATIAKTLTSKFYHQPPKKSYYIGCSGGGRQGLKAAEMYPKDYDGILIGAPASNFNNMSSWRASFAGKTGAPGSMDFISPAMWQGLIHDEVLKQCDFNDGVRDGILENPGECGFDPARLLCREGTTNSSACLSLAQVGIVKSVFSPLYGEGGELVYPAMQPGSEIAASTGLYSGTPFPYSVVRPLSSFQPFQLKNKKDWFRYVVHKDPLWDPLTFSGKDISLAQSLNPLNVQSFPNNLTTFHANNGKMIIYHGLQDQQISSFATNRLHNHLAESVASRAQLDSFLRYFQISGLNHCNSGPGAWMIGQSTLGDSERGFRKENNVLAALVAWVENERAPETVEGVKFEGDRKGGMVLRTRRHCAWPSVNRFLGSEGEKGENWVCV